MRWWMQCDCQDWSSFPKLDQCLRWAKVRSAARPGAFLIFGIAIGLSGDDWRTGFILIGIGLLLELIWLGIMLSPRLLRKPAEKKAAQAARSAEAERQRALQAASILPFWSLLMPSFAVVGIWLLVMGTGDYLEARSSQSWPSVAGQIVDSRIVSDTRRDSDGDRYSVYRADVTYEYTVRDQTYVSNRIDLSGFSSSRDPHVAARELEAYPRGGEVTVYYNPNNPGKALLDRSMPPHTYMIVGLVLLGCVAMLGAGVLYVRRGITKATGEVPRWEDLIFSLKYIPGGHG
jgi:hypothetical protein